MVASQVDHASGPQAAVDISRVLDGAPFGRVQRVVLALTFLTLVMDGFDIQAIAFAAPGLTQAWGIERSELGPVLASALLGMAVGAAGIGLLGDRYGRRHALIASCALMAFGSLGSAVASSAIELGVLRFITGIGMGGALPNSTALMFEFAPKIWRQVATSAALVGVPLGGMFGAAIARPLVPEFGWQALFVIGGVIPALLALLMWKVLPESPRYLCTQPSRTDELSALMNRLAGSAVSSGGSRFIGASAQAEAVTQPQRSVLASIFAKEYRRDTLTLWLIFFTNVFSIYFFFNWLPTVLAAADLAFGVAVSGSFYFNLGGVLGSLATSTIIGRYGSKAVLSIVAALAVASVVAIASSTVLAPDSGHASVFTLMLTMALAGGCVNSVQIGMFSVAAYVYPTRCRSTGVGWSLAVARFGGIVSSFAGAAFFSLGMRPQQFFFFIAGTLTLTFVGVAVLRRHIPASSAGDHP